MSFKQTNLFQPQQYISYQMKPPQQYISYQMKPPQHQNSFNQTNLFQPQQNISYQMKPPQHQNTFNQVQLQYPFNKMKIPIFQQPFTITTKTLNMDRITEIMNNITKKELSKIITFQKKFRNFLKEKKMCEVFCATLDKNRKLREDFWKTLDKKNETLNKKNKLYKDFCATLEHIPRAESGITPVWLPSKFPKFVFKESGKDAAKLRFGQMRYVRSILKKINASHLKVPYARLYGKYIIEQRVPIEKDVSGVIHYINQPKLFDEAIKESVRLFSNIYIGDLLMMRNQTITPLAHIPEVHDHPRYDNFCPYLELGKDGKIVGKIGLLDLERMEGNSKPEGFALLASLFPYHVQEIKDEIKKLNNIKTNIDPHTLDVIAKEGKKRLEIQYVNYINYLKQKGVSINNKIFPEPLQPLPVFSQKELENDIKKIINENKINSFNVQKKHTNQHENSNNLEKEIIKTVIDKINISILKKRNTEFDINKTTWVQLLDFRNFFMPSFDLLSGVYDLLKPTNTDKLTDQEKDLLDSKVKKIFYRIMFELQKSGTIFYFDPMDYSHGAYIGYCWFRL